MISSNALSSQKAKHYANKGANSSKICIGNEVVIYLDILQDVSEIRKIIDIQVAVQNYTN